MNNYEMLNNEQQQAALNTFAQFNEKIKAQILTHKEPPQKLDKSSPDAYINMMTDLVFTNPYVLVRMEDDTDAAEIYHTVETYKNGSEHYGLIIYTHSSNQEPGTHVKAVPFVEIMETFVKDPALETCQINPTEEFKFILIPENIKEFLQFKPDNIEFIGF